MDIISKEQAGSGASPRCRCLADTFDDAKHFGAGASKVRNTGKRPWIISDGGRLVSLHNDYDSLILERRVSAWQG